MAGVGDAGTAPIASKTPDQVINTRFLISLGVEVDEKDVPTVNTFIQNPEIPCLYAYQSDNNCIVTTRLPGDDEGIEMICYILKTTKQTGPVVLTAENIHGKVRKVKVFFLRAFVKAASIAQAQAEAART